MTRGQKALTAGGAVALAATALAYAALLAARMQPIAQSTGLRMRAAKLAAAGRNAEAEATLRRAILLTPNSAEGHYSLANILCIEGHNRDALGECDLVLRLSPKHPYVYLVRARCWVQLDDAKKAVAICESAVNQRPYDSERRGALGWALLEARDYRESELQLKQALEQRPSMADAWQWLGYAQMEQHHAEDAAASYRRALKLEPGNGHAHLALGIALRKLGDREAARQHLQTAVSVSKEAEVRNSAKDELSHLK